jgi:hypothetical protein
MMKVFIAGIMQGSKKGKGIHEQDYRRTIRDAILARYPEAEVVDPFSLFPDSVDYDDGRAKEVLFAMAAEAGSSDILIAYLPSASMGTALEMISAHEAGKLVISITPMEKNWFILAYSAETLPSLDAFYDWMARVDLEELIAISRGE